MGTYNNSNYNQANYNYDTTLTDITYLFNEYFSELVTGTNLSKFINLEFDYCGNLETDLEYSVINIEQEYNSSLNFDATHRKIINNDKIYNSVLNFKADSGMYDLNVDYSAVFNLSAKSNKHIYTGHVNNSELDFKSKFSKLYTNEEMLYNSTLSVNLNKVNYIHNVDSFYQSELFLNFDFVKKLNLVIENNSDFYTELYNHGKNVYLEELYNSTVEILPLIRKNIDIHEQEYFVDLFTVASLYSVRFEEFTLDVELLPGEEIIIDSNAYEVYKNNQSILYTHTGDWLFMERIIKQIDLNYTNNSDIVTTVEYNKRWL